MKKMLLLTVALVLVAGVAMAGTSVVNSAHDMRTWITNETTTQVCVFCHTPHMAAGRTQDPLWNHSLSNQASYGVYSSQTMNATPTEIVGSGQSSLLCLSCHDGSVAVNSLWKAPVDGNVGSTYIAPLNATAQITSGANLGVDLTNDHPINFSYAVSAGADNTIVTTPSGSTPLFGGTVQCGSCHNVHNPTFAPFLRMSNSGSGLCLNCHIK